jgi:hypothetical protein
VEGHAAFTSAHLWLCSLVRFGEQASAELSGLPAEFPAQTLPGRSLLGSLLLAWFQVKRVFLDLFDDVFLLHFALETLQRTFQGFSILDEYFGQVLNHLLPYGPMDSTTNMLQKLTASGSAFHPAGCLHFRAKT